jgi:protein-tyrosine-phosphatase
VAHFHLDPADIGAVLFACTMNSVRSPMAAALLRQRWGGRIFVDSCGVRKGGEPDPFAEVVMDEVGLDLNRHHAKTFAELEDGSFDLVISLSPEAQHGAVELSRGRATELEYWPTFDPTIAEGSREQRLDAYRRVRDELERRIAERFPRPSTFGG